MRIRIQITTIKSTCRTPACSTLHDTLSGKSISLLYTAKARCFRVTFIRIKMFRILHLVFASRAMSATTQADRADASNANRFGRKILIMIIESEVFYFLRRQQIIATAQTITVISDTLILNRSHPDVHVLCKRSNESDERIIYRRKNVSTDLKDDGQP